MHVELENKHLVIIVVVLILFIWFFTRSEGMENTVQSYNPRSFQPFIQEQVKDDNLIELPKEADYPWTANPGNYGEVDILDDGAKGNLDVGFNVCSKSCCSPTYPPPFLVGTDDYVLMNGKNFVPSSYTCTDSWNNSGCMCMTKEQALFLNKRGNNA